MAPLSRRKFICISLGTGLATVLGNLGCGVTETIAVKEESGDFLAEVNRLKKLVVPKESKLYQPPTAKELERFRLLVRALVTKRIEEARRLAYELNYELVKFTDTPRQLLLYGLREKKGQVRGWGSYFINSSYQHKALIEVPHPIFDQFSEEIGAKTFLQSKAFGFLIAGAHRNANGIGTADVCHLSNSIFQEVHEVWTREAVTLQIHGFNLSNQPDFPFNTQVVLSNGSGKGNISSEILGLIQRLNNAGFQAYLYTKLTSPSMKQVNRGIAGSRFSHLGGTTNVQGTYCSRLGKTFIHIELEQSVRYNSLQRDRVSQLIANSIHGNT